VRARLLLLLLAVALLPIVAGLARGGADQPEPVVVYVVQPGDSLWRIADRLDRPGDPRALVDDLATANGVHGALQVGQELRLPAPLEPAPAD
jgi:LysM domain-containing protein